MKLTSFEAIASALEKSGVRYLIVGGLAVNAHGYLRLTMDVDVVVKLVPENILNLFNALKPLGYAPLVPISGEQFADKNLRERWIREKGMQVLQMWSDVHPETPVDIFVYEPFPFDEEFKKALIKPLHSSPGIRFVSIGTLISMKEAANRPKDIDDIQHLRIMQADDARE